MIQVSGGKFSENVITPGIAQLTLCLLSTPGSCPDLGPHFLSTLQTGLLQTPSLWGVSLQSSAFGSQEGRMLSPSSSGS